MCKVSFSNNLMEHQNQSLMPFKGKWSNEFKYEGNKSVLNAFNMKFITKCLVINIRIFKWISWKDIQNV